MTKGFIKCNICEKSIETDLYSFHAYTIHPNYEFRTKYILKEKKYYIPELNRWTSSKKELVQVLNKNNMLLEYYFKEYGQSSMKEYWDKNKHPLYGNSKNSDQCLYCNKKTLWDKYKTCWAVFCGSSCSTNWHNENTNRAKRSYQTLKNREDIDTTFCWRDSQKQYWINKGYCIEEAKKNISKRQSFTSLESFQERYGITEGEQKYNDRINKWFSSIKNNNQFKGYSNISKELFDSLDLKDQLLYGNNEYTLLSVKNLSLDCVLLSKNKVIEFYGDYWHGNPIKYNDDDIIGFKNKRSVKEQHIYDKNRENIIKDAGFEIKIIWENDYKKNKKQVIKECNEFLK